LTLIFLGEIAKPQLQNFRVPVPFLEYFEEQIIFELQNATPEKLPVVSKVFSQSHFKYKSPLTGKS
jgi:hypothetical protein